MYLGHNKLINDKRNFEEKVDCIGSTLNNWQQRELTLFSRVLIIKNTFALSKITLPARVMCIPYDITKGLPLCCISSYGEQKIIKCNVY